jgi:hypothetical protein
MGQMNNAPLDNPFGYSGAVWTLFQQPGRAGRFAEGTPGVVGGRATTRAARSVLQLWFRVENGQVRDARFQAYGCPTSIAVRRLDRTGEHRPRLRRTAWARHLCAARRA